MIDLTVMKAFESGALDVPHFYFTGDDYDYRFEPEAKRRFVEVLRERFNSGAAYKGRVMKWDTVMQEKLCELARCLNGRSRSVDFSEPAPILESADDRAVRKAILGLSQSEARERGIGKSTFHYLRKSAERDRPFQVYRRVRRRLEARTENLTD